jgi:hypothetical protein
MPPPYPDQRREALDTLSELFQNKSHVRVIHYSCESFECEDNQLHSPRITSVAVRRLDVGQVAYFSIHDVAEGTGALTETRDDLDSLEREMLRRFYEQVQLSGEVEYLHWNMRDARYGFAAIDHRYEILGGSPIMIPERSRLSLSQLLLDIYGTEYIEHPRLESLGRKNGITMLGFLGGADEARAFSDGRYADLQQSTLRKVDVLADIAERTYRRTLKTDSRWWMQHGGNLRGAWDWVVSNATILFVISFASLVLGASALWVGELALRR